MAMELQRPSFSERQRMKRNAEKARSMTPAQSEELKAAHQRIDELKASLAEMVEIYWGAGDGIHPEPMCIQRAVAALAEEILDEPANELVRDNAQFGAGA